MKITSFCPLQTDTADKGLQIVKMQKLGMIVALAGANGSGKSRLLDSLRWHANSGSSRYEDYLNSKHAIEHYTARLNAAETTDTNDQIRMEIPSWKNIIADQTFIRNKYECIETDSPTEQINIINFVPKYLNLSDPSSKPSDNIQVCYASALNPGIDGMHDTAPSYIQHLQNEWHEATHQGFTGDTSTVAAIKQNYESLKKLVKELLKTDLNRQSGQVTLFGKKFGQAQLSDGQKVLLQLVVALHAQKEGAGQILVMDEPENHIHTAALIEIFDNIQNALPNTQLWIATHSIPLLAHLYTKDPNCIWYH